MKSIKKFKNVPDNSIILKDFGRVDYCDSFRTLMQTEDNVDKVASELFILPDWVKCLMKIRDFAVKMFKLKTANKNDKLNIDTYYPVGSKLIYFDVIDRNDNEIIMGDNDKHLNFKISVLLNHSQLYTTLHVTTIVQFNNIWGRLYFLPVKPFHKLIVRSMLNNVNNKQN